MELADPRLWAILYVGSEWVIRIIMLVVVPFRRSPDAAKGWLLAIFFFPWPALLAYWLIGRPTMPAWRAARFARVPAIFEPIRERLLKQVHLTAPTLTPALQHAAALVANLGHLRPLSGNALELLSDYDDSVNRLVADIEQARHHVHLLYYIFADDACGMKVVKALTAAAGRGVQCRVMADALGTRRWLKSLTTKLEAAGVMVRPILPVYWFRRHSARADLRNHRKIAVIDGRIGFTGSQNIVDAAFKPGITYQEMVVRATGPVVLQLQAAFVADWFLETEETLDADAFFPPPDVPGNSVAQMLPSGPDYPTSNVQRLIVALIHGARQRVVITTPYFVPDDALLQALETAALRGVEVHLIVSQLADQLLVGMAQRSYYAELLQNGIHIHLFQGKFLHAKHTSIDDSLALIGSSNMDIRSFVLNAEVTLAIYDPEVVARLHAEEARNIANSKPLLLEEWERRSLGAKVAENLARLMSPLL